MNTPEFLAHLKTLDIHVTLNGDKLRCDAPEGALTPEILETLGQWKPEIIAYLSEAHQPASRQALQVVPRDRPLPPAISQEAIYSLARLNPQSPLYNMYLAFDLCGLLDVTLLEQALREVVNRHEVLHTRFESQDGQVFALPSIAEPWTMEVITPPAAAQSDLLAWAESQVQAAIRQPFALDSRSFLRARLYTLAADHHRLCLVMHHLVSDGWSWNIFLQEAAAQYRGLCRGEAVDLPDLPIQYADFAAWQRGWVDSPAALPQRNYWEEKLRGVQEIQLPTQSSAIAAQAFHGARRSKKLPAELTQLARSASRRAGVSLFVTLLAAFKAALYSYYRQEDLVVCTPAANRSRAEVQPLIGYFNNLLVHRTRFTGDPTFAGLAGRVKVTSQEAQEHQEFPFPRLLDLPGASRVQLARAVFAYQDRSGRTLGLDGLAVTPLEVYNETANFDLFLTVEEGTKALECTLEYKTARFEPSRIEEMLDRYLDALATALEQPDLRLSAWADKFAPVPNPQAGQPRPSLEDIPVLPSTPVQKKLVQLWEEQLGVRPASIRDSFFALGGHSLMALRLFGRIEKEIGAILPLSVLFDNPTIEKLSELIEKRYAELSWSCLVPIQPLGSQPPFFAVHGLEGNILFWRSLVEHLGSDQPFYGLQARGLDGYQAAGASIEAMARQYVQELCAVQDRGPYYLGGYSLGGEIALEMALQLTAAGEKVALLVLFDTSNPVRPVRAAVHAFHRAQGAMQPEYPGRARVFQQKLARHARRLVAQSPREKLRYLRSEWRRRSQRLKLDLSVWAYRRTGRRLPGPLLQEYLRQSHVRALDRYVPAVFPGQITLFRARRSLEQNPLEDPLGWAPLAAQGLDVHIFESTHQMFSKSFAAEVGERLRACIEKARSAGRGVDG